MSEGQRRWSEVSEEEANPYRGDPARRVVAPAMALIVTGCLGIAANCLLAGSLQALRQDQRPAGTDDEASQAREWGRRTGDCCAFSLPTLAVYPLVIVAGMRMRQLQNRWLAILGAVLGMTPCSPVMLLGLPVGAWSLIVLYDSAVEKAFADNRPRR